MTESELVLVDVGGVGGLQPCWEPFRDRIVPVVFEPSPEGAAALRRDLGSNAIVIADALSDVACRRALHIAKCPGCTSLLESSRAVLSTYSVHPAFLVVDKVEVDCVRYDGLYAAGHVPAPDVIKIDVQGFEYEVLTGFGTLLSRCLAVQLEAHFYPIYEGQRLLGDLVALLRGHGLTLRKLAPINHFDGDIVEVDAWFTRPLPDEQRLGDEDRAKLTMIEAAWQLPARPGTFDPLTWG